MAHDAYRRDRIPPDDLLHVKTSGDVERAVHYLHDAAFSAARSDIPDDRLRTELDAAALVLKVLGALSFSDHNRVMKERISEDSVGWAIQTVELYLGQGDEYVHSNAKILRERLLNEHHDIGVIKEYQMPANIRRVLDNQEPPERNLHGRAS